MRTIFVGFVGGILLAWWGGKLKPVEQKEGEYIWRDLMAEYYSQRL